MTLHLFEINPHHGAVRLIADEELLFERPELAARNIAGNARSRLAHLVVGKINRWRFELRDPLGLDHHPAAALRIFGPFAEFAVRFLVPAIAAGMADELAGLQMLQRTRAVPRPL